MSQSKRLLKDDDSSCSLVSVRNSIAAGYVAGISGTLVGHPFDSLKVLYQTQHQRQAISVKLATSSFSPPSMPTTRGMHSIATTTTNLHHHPTTSYLRQLRSLYAGISAPLLTVGLVQSVNFAVYDSMRRLLYSLQPQQHDGYNNNNKNYIGHDSMTNVAIASSTAGAVLVLFTSPLLIVKTAQQTVPGLGLGQAVQRTWRSGLFAGFGPHFFSETAGRAIYFCSYESTASTH